MIVAIVIPCYNERATIPLIVNRLSFYVQDENFIMFVDDGSTDGTWEECRRMRSAAGPMIDIARLFENRGHQAALLAGLIAVKGRCECAITMDADCQHPPSAIPDFLEKFRQGADIVYGVRRRNPSLWSRLFYRLMGDALIPNHGDYRLISAKVLDTLTPDSEPFLRGLFADKKWKSAIVEYDEQPRIAGRSTYTFRKRIGLAFAALKWRVSLWKPT